MVHTIYKIKDIMDTLSDHEFISREKNISDSVLATFEKDYKAGKTRIDVWDDVTGCIVRSYISMVPKNGGTVLYYS